MGALHRLAGKARTDFNNLAAGAVKTDHFSQLYDGSGSLVRSIRPSPCRRHPDASQGEADRWVDATESGKLPAMIRAARFCRARLAWLVLILLTAAPAGATVPRPPIIAAEAWGSQPANFPAGYEHEPKVVLLHHAGELWKTGADPAERLRALQSWGKRDKDWADVPYHFIIAPDGRIFEGRSMQYRPDTNTDFDTTGYINVELLGNFEEQRVSRPQLDAAVALTAWLADELDSPTDQIQTHKGVAPGQTSCPGKDFLRYIDGGHFARWVNAERTGEEANVQLLPPAENGPTEVATVSRFDAADHAIRSAISRGEIPGAVLVAGNRDGILHEMAFGRKSIEDEQLTMTTDAVFDLASLTKPIATATSVLILADRGEIELSAPVAKYLPAFGNRGKEAITVEQLLLHRGGLIPDNPMSDYQGTPEAAIEAIMSSEPRWEPGSRFAYTDVGFIVLAELIEAVDGRPVDQFAKAEIFEPLGMNDTTFRPSESLGDRLVPTTTRDGQWMLGDVHDPRAYALGGIAGHAGLFGTAADVSRWVRMLLNGGELEGRRILSEEMVGRMLQRQSMPDGTGGRGLGVDISSSYSAAPRGEGFAVGKTFGHTGYTGTAFWADPQGSGTFYVLLTNRVHPDDTGKVGRVRREVATAVAAVLLGQADENGQVAVKNDPKLDPVKVTNGVDVLARRGFEPLRGRKIAIVTNHTGLTRDGKRIVDLLHEADDVEVVKLFSPEHGLYGNVDEKVGHGTDEKTGLPVYSLYGETRKPSAEMMEGVDTLVYDIQDIGTRFYTYISTMGLCMEAAKEHGARVIVLDRPNPITGTRVFGPVADERYLGFTAYKPIPLVHGMTVGELAGLFNTHFGIGCDLEVVKMEGWRRDMWFDETGQRWVNPSPNMRNLIQATIYPAIGLLESGRQISCGRGTDQPFELFGAPWIDELKLAAALNDLDLKGLRFIPVRFTPDVRHYAGQECGGAYVLVTDREALDPVAAGCAIAWTIEALFGESYELKSVAPMIQDTAAMQAIVEADDPHTISQTWQQELDAFKRLRQEYLIYD